MQATIMAGAMEWSASIPMCWLRTVVCWRGAGKLWLSTKRRYVRRGWRCWG